MFSFVDNYLNRKAMKQAIKELDKENTTVSASVNPVATTREYKTIADADPFSSIKIKSVVNKPLTTAVDLKNFKDWRNVNSVKSNNPKYEPKSRFSFDDDDDDGEAPKIKFPRFNSTKNDVKSDSKTVVNEKVFGSSVEEDATEKNTSIDSFFKEKFNAIRKSENLNNDTSDSVEYTSETEPKTVPETKPETHKKTTLNQMLANKLKENPSLQDKINEIKVTASKQSTSSNEVIKSEEPPKKIKVEVIDLSKDKNEQPKPKKATTRKQRGKNKRRFDADVISNIDWK